MHNWLKTGIKMPKEWVAPEAPVKGTGGYYSQIPASLWMFFKVLEKPLKCLSLKVCSYLNDVTWYL